MSTKYIWTKIPVKEEIKRSSHSFCVIGNKGYIFGGEIKPRQPVDNALHVIDLSTGVYNKVQGAGDVPDSRVGHTGVVLGEEIYVFGGRGGPDMTPLIENGAIHRYTPSTNLWTRLRPDTSSPYPLARSYHASAASPLTNQILIHAGCGDASTGRVNDLWAFDISSNVWSELPDAPGEKGRGGTALTVLNDTVWRFGGFDGKTEIGGAIDSLSLNLSLQGGSWESINYDSKSGPTELEKMGNGPGARSVAGLLVLDKDKLVTLFGEGKPSPTGGHDSAGNFWGDVWTFDIQRNKWEELSVEVEGQGDGPGERGWFDSDVIQGGGVVVWGGIDSRNERMGDGWILKRL
ncbi:hypothetical protein BCR39DRAFT_539103 [Naematelia encephala]|uniref:Galactose oxidase n=1 Tax=Naematelia encephala TaxID=71784 RepID=A0A1Y2AX01_9TREE|nr:hypothetical protein BCR39DRAFT_539103 [Naematelia encephala]